MFSNHLPEAKYRLFTHCSCPNTHPVIHPVTPSRCHGLCLHQGNQTDEPASGLEARSLGYNKQTDRHEIMIQPRKGNTKSQRTHKHYGGVTAFRGRADPD